MPWCRETRSPDNSGDGVRVDQGSYNTIGTPDAGNTITGNTGAGVSVIGDYAFANSIRGNVINSNGGLAIDLGGDGRTANDPGDTDFGPTISRTIRSSPASPPGPRPASSAP